MFRCFHINLLPFPVYYYHSISHKDIEGNGDKETIESASIAEPLPLA